MTKLFFATDVHGSDICWSKFLNAGKFYEVDVLILGGDMTGKAVVPFMGEGSAIINFSSQAGRDGGGPGACAYATAKGALMTFTRSMAKELGPKGIRVNALCPGMIATSFHDTFTKDEVRANVAAATPVRRQGNAAEIAEAVAFLASGEARFIHGANIDINGGMFFS